MTLIKKEYRIMHDGERFKVQVPTRLWIFVIWHDLGSFKPLMPFATVDLFDTEAEATQAADEHINDIAKRKARKWRHP